MTRIRRFTRLSLEISENIEVLTNLIGIPKIIEQAAVAGVLNEQQIYNIEAASSLLKEWILSGFYEKGWKANVDDDGMKISRKLEGS